MPRKKAPKEQRTDNTLEEFTETLVTPEEREEMIAEAAYYRAEQHGFDPGSIDEDWFEAEKVVDDILFREVEESLEH